MSPLEWHRVCLTCNKYYKEINNIGTWNCSYHPGAYNAECDGYKFPKYSYECCGASPEAYLDDGSRNPYFNPLYLNGCTMKDHSSSKRHFSVSDRLTEHQFPKILLKELKSDIAQLTNTNMKNKLTYRHKGLKIDDNTGFLYIDRKDVIAEDWRKKNKIYLHKNLTKHIKFVIDSIDDGYNRIQRTEKILRIDDTSDIKKELTSMGFFNIAYRDTWFSQEIELPITDDEHKRHIHKLPAGYKFSLLYNNIKDNYYITRL